MISLEITIIENLSQIEWTTYKDLKDSIVSKVNLSELGAQEKNKSLIEIYHNLNKTLDNLSDKCAIEKIDYKADFGLPYKYKLTRDKYEAKDIITRN